MSKNSAEDKNEFTIDIERLEDYKFRVEFDKETMGELVTDESEEAGGDETGPNPSRLLAVSSLNCLMASLVFCLKKKRVELDSLKGSVTGTIERIDGRLRVTRLDVTIKPEIDSADKKKLKKCVDIFEDYCVVTQSIRKGIDVEVEVEAV
ncbi:MAG: OsmC family protein [Candidatus Thermoplasmatota archaeon]|nr:OsmC family protein [Candidatus Thermoplasmatota archaeon]MBS3789712.1 OsmC family protein [Candidatus Thermoplasmatota archaeon]